MELVIWQPSLQYIQGVLIIRNNIALSCMMSSTASSTVGEISVYRILFRMRCLYNSGVAGQGRIFVGWFRQFSNVVIFGRSFFIDKDPFFKPRRNKQSQWFCSQRGSCWKWWRRSLYWITFRTFNCHYQRWDTCFKIIQLSFSVGEYYSVDYGEYYVCLFDNAAKTDIS